jgi:hypothetical protein
MNEEPIAVGDHFRSNNGKGPETAVVTSINGDRVSLVRRADAGRRMTPFTLPLAFFSHESCGWKRCNLRGHER